MTEECARIGKVMGGCKWEARYDFGTPTMEVSGSTLLSALSVIEASCKKTYVRDICVTCGRTIERVK